MIILILLLLIFPFSINAAVFEPNYPNRYYGYFQTVLKNGSNVMLSYYNNTYVEDDRESSLQILSSNSNINYQLTVSAYGIYRADVSTGVFSGLNDTDLHFWEQDICISSNDVSFHIRNATQQDFASNENPLVIITSNKCKLYGSNPPDNVVGPKYWEWLSDYEGYVIKIFMPIAQWHSSSTANGTSWSVTSTLNVQNKSTYEIYYRFLTSGGLYDHNRYFEIDDSFDLDTKNFNLTYDAIMDGIDVLDTSTGLTYNPSRNMFDKSSTLGGWVRALDGTVLDQYTDTYNYTPFIKVTPNTTYTIDLYNSSGLGSAGICEYSSNSQNTFIKAINESQRYITFKTGPNTQYIRFTVRVDSKSNVQMVKGSTVGIYCPYGPTLDNNCIVNDDLEFITWDEGNLFNNLWSIINLPIKLGAYVVKGCNGDCSPLNFTVFNHDIPVPCGTFFWGRNDVQPFRTTWNLLFGGFIIYNLLIWLVRICINTLDPLSDSVGTSLDLIDSHVSNIDNIGKGK